MKPINWEIQETIPGQAYLYLVYNIDELCFEDYYGYIRFASISSEEVPLAGILEEDFIDILINRMKFLQTTEHTSFSLSLVILCLKVVRHFWERVWWKKKSW